MLNEAKPRIQKKVNRILVQTAKPTIQKKNYPPL